LSWQDKPEVKKGDIGEDIVDCILSNMGYSSFKNNDNCSHPIDRIYIHRKTHDIKVIDVKCKQLRDKYPDTGFPFSNFKVYRDINKAITVEIWFVDCVKGEIYGNTLDKLKEMKIVNGKTYPSPESNVDGTIIYFPYENMVKYAYLTEEQIEVIKKVPIKSRFNVLLE